MPLNAKGQKILKSMVKTYGSEKKAKSVLYASKNAGKITEIDALADGVAQLSARMGKFLMPPTVRSGAMRLNPKLPTMRVDIDPATVAAAIGLGKSIDIGWDIGKEHLNKYLSKREESKKQTHQLVTKHRASAMHGILAGHGWEKQAEEEHPGFTSYQHGSHPNDKIYLSSGRFLHLRNGEYEGGGSGKHNKTLTSYLDKNFKHAEHGAPAGAPSGVKSDASEVILDRKRVDAIADAVNRLGNRMLTFSQRRKPMIPTGKRGLMANRRRGVRIDGEGEQITPMRLVGKSFESHEGPADEVLSGHGWSPKTVDEGVGIKEWKHSAFPRHRITTSPQSWQHTRSGVSTALPGGDRQAYGHGKFEENPEDIKHFGDYVGALHSSHALRGRAQHSALEHATAAKYWATPKPKEEPFFSELSPAWRDVRPAKAVKHGVLALAKGAGPKTWKAAGERVKGEVARSQAAMGKAEQEQHQARQAKTSLPNWRGIGRAGQQAFWTHKTRGEFKNVKGALQKADSLEEDERRDSAKVDDLAEWGEAPQMLKSWRRTKPGGMPQKSHLYFQQGGHKLVVHPGGWHHYLNNKKVGEGGPSGLANYLKGGMARGDAGFDFNAHIEKQIARQGRTLNKWSQNLNKTMRGFQPQIPRSRLTDAERERSPANLKRRSALEHAVGAAKHLYRVPNVDPVGYVAHTAMARMKGADTKTLNQAKETVRGWPGSHPVTLKRLLGRNKASAQIAGNPKLLPKLDALADACAKLEKRMADAEQKRADGILGGLPSIAGGPHAMDLHVAKSELAGATKKVNKFTAKAAFHEKMRNPFGSDFNTLRAQHYGIAQRGAARRLGELQGS